MFLAGTFLFWKSIIPPPCWYARKPEVPHVLVVSADGHMDADAAKTEAAL